MNDERWTLVDRLLGEALERQPHERQAFLREACGGDEALRLDVESLVTHATSGADILSTPAVAFADGIKSTGTSMMGRHVGPYAIAARLGAGGMGEVYRARDPKLGRDVAIKILPRVFATDPDRRARLDREARLLAALNHPHIGAIYGLEALDGTPALVLELVDGDTLAERIAKGPIPLTETLRIARQIADALDAAHDKGIVHRDLKPANIKITPDGIVKVLDFGLAKAAGGDGSGPDLTQSPTVSIGGTHDGVILGTAPYMSPEQARGKPIDKRTDVWAFGCVLYEMLTGRVAFAGDTVSDTIVTILDREPDWSALPATTPAPIRRLLLRCLDKDAKRRLRDIGDARTEIDDVVSGTTVVVPPVAITGPTATSGAQVAAAPAWGRRVALVLALLGLCLAGAAGVYLATRGGSPSSAAATFSLQDAEIVSLTTTGNATLPSLSFDGQWVTYVQQDGDGTSLWIRRTTTTNPPVLLVPAQPRINIWGATIAPDGSWVDFLRQEGAKAVPDGLVQLMRVSSTGVTTPKPLIDHVHTPVAYSPDGRMMVFHRYHPEGGGSQLVLADVQGQNEKVLALVPATSSGPWFHHVRYPGTGHVRPAWSPDGKVIAIPGFTFDGGPAPYAMFVTVDDGKIEAVAQTAAGTGAWIDPSSLVWSQSERAGAHRQLWRLTYPAAERSRLTNDFSSYIGVSLSADRDSLVTAKTDNRAGISILDNTTRTSGREAVTDAAISVVEGSSVAWAPGRLLYSARTGDHFELRAFYPKRNNTESIVTDAYGPAATSDGTTIVYVSSATHSLWRADADGTHGTKLANHAQWPVTTHDDQHVIFLSAIPGFAISPYSVPIKGGKPVQIINRGVSSLDVSPDGRLAFTSNSRDGKNQRVLVVCDLQACGVTQRETPLVNSLGRIRWRRGKGTSGVAYVGLVNGQQNIWVQPPNGSPAERLTDFMDGREIIDFAWSRDGEHLAIARPTRHSDIVLFKNLWRRP